MTTQNALRQVETPRAVTEARTVLVAAAVLSVAAAFGPTWVVRVGVGVAVIGGVVAVVQILRALSHQRQQAAEKLLAQTKTHGTALHTERVHNAEVLEVLSTRISSTRESLTTATAEMARQRTKISSLREELRTEHATSSDLRLELDELQSRLSRTQETVAEQDAELFVLRAEAEASTDAEVVGIPRRGRSDRTAEGRTASAG